MKVGVGILAISLCYSVNAQAVSERKTNLSPYCAVGDDSFGSVPGVQSYAGHQDGLALRKSDGGLISIKMDRGIGCEVKLQRVDNKLYAHVVARRVSYDLPPLDKDRISLIEPKQRIDYWEKDVDLTNIDKVEMSATEVPLDMKIVVGVLRTEF